jgi:FixJ family two-component response regulator
MIRLLGKQYDPTQNFDFFSISHVMRQGTRIAVDQTANMLDVEEPLNVASNREILCRVDIDLLRSIQSSKLSCIVLSPKSSISDLEWIQLAYSQHSTLVIVMLVRAGDIFNAVSGVRLGGSEMVEIPSQLPFLVRCISRTLQTVETSLSSSRSEALNQLSLFTPRQVRVLESVLQGQASKLNASHLSISQRTVKNHRASFMTKTGSRSLPVLTRLAVAPARQIPVVPDRVSILRRFAYIMSSGKKYSMA